MTEELKTCDFYNEKICTLFSKYFGFNVECENVFLSTIDCDIERECPIKRLEFELKVTKADYEASEQENKEEKKAYNECIHYLACMTEQRNKLKTALEEIREIEELAFYSKGMPEEPLSQRDFILHAINDYEQRRIKILTKINEVLEK